MLKKICSVLLLVTILATVISTVFAIEQFPDATRDIPGVSMNVSIKKNGNKIKGSAGVTNLNGGSVKMTVQVQKKTGSKWTKVKGKSGGDETYVEADYAKGTYRTYVEWTYTDTQGKVHQMTPSKSKEKTFN